jgi:hypothetical protein
MYYTYRVGDYFPDSLFLVAGNAIIIDIFLLLLRFPSLNFLVCIYGCDGPEI